MVMLAGERTHLFNFGGRDVAWVNPAYASTFVMNLEHDSRRLFSIQRKKTLENDDYEIHGRVIVVQQHHLIHLRRLQLGALCLKLSAFLKPRSHAFDSIQSDSIC